MAACGGGSQKVSTHRGVCEVKDALVGAISAKHSQRNNTRDNDQEKQRQMVQPEELMGEPLAHSRFPTEGMRQCTVG